jgi:hypothetical protein
VERTSARLVIGLGDGGDRVVDLHEGRVDVGRAADASIRLALPEVSAHHAELHWDGARLRVRDLSSTNGTQVNGSQVSAWTDLHDGDRIRWGPVAAQVVLARPEPPGAALDQAGATLTWRPPTPAARPSARRIFISHASEDKRRARHVAAILRRQGWDTWLDESDIRGGARWAASIQQALRSCSVVVLRQGRLNPDRVRMRIGRVIAVIGAVLVVVGFASFVYAGFRASQSASSGFPVPVLVAFAVFFCGGILGATGTAMVRAGRAKGL